MRTSRIARDTAIVSEILSPCRSSTRRQTRSTTESTIPTPITSLRPRTSSPSSSIPSSPLSPPPDIEDHPFLASPKPPTGKRKRGAATPSTSATSTSSGTRKRGPKVEEGDGSRYFEGEVGGEREGRGKKGKKAKRQPAKEIKTEDGDVKIHAPAHWEEVYEAVREMRKGGGAPVDTMGCERLADRSMSEKDQRFQTLIALMLSSQTKDTVTAATMRTLNASLPGGLALSSILSCPPDTLNDLIRPIGFHNTKTRHIKAAALLLEEKYHGDIPDSIPGLMSLPGVGPKMAHLTLSAAWGRTEGIGVDVHVHRITNLWGWHKTKGPEETRKVLESWLPRKRWREINTLLVGFGQTVCLPVGRRCGECGVGRRGLCPGAVVGKKRGVVGRVKREDGDGRGGVVVREEERVAGGGRMVREGVLGKEEVAVKEEEVLEGGRYVLDPEAERVKVEEGDGEV